MFRKKRVLESRRDKGANEVSENEREDRDTAGERGFLGILVDLAQ